MRRMEVNFATDLVKMPQSPSDTIPILISLKGIFSPHLLHSALPDFALSTTRFEAVSELFAVWTVASSTTFGKIALLMVSKSLSESLGAIAFPRLLIGKSESFTEVAVSVRLVLVLG
jgi:hypothetical protein